MAEQPSEREALPKFEDARVQLVYQILCSDDHPDGDEHWEGFAARRIVAALSQPSTEQGWTHEINQELERQYLKGFQAGKAFAVSEQGWRTIESAPRDGTMFLCWVRAERYGETDEGQQYQHDESQVDFCWWRTLAESPDGGYFDPACGQIGDRQFVSHWMPLPPPPIEPREEKL